MRIVYLGSADIGLPTLRALIAAGSAGRHELLAVVTQPDRPAGRGQSVKPSLLKALALGAGIPVLQPERLRRPEAVEALRSLAADVFVVFAYGQILPPSVLALPRVACLNLHASLLPRHRGAAPIHAAVLAGDRESGLDVMYMDEGLDTGDVLLEKRTKLQRRETAGSLHDRLALMAPEALFEALDLLAAGNAPRRPQDNALATYAPKLERQSGLIDWTAPARSIERLVYGMNPWPGAFTWLPAVEGGAPRLLKVFKAFAFSKSSEGQPGEVVKITSFGPLVATGQGRIVLIEVQVEGKRRMRAADFLRGNPLAVGRFWVKKIRVLERVGSRCEVRAMSTITLTLRDERLIEIRELAQGTGMTPEEWLQNRIEAMLINPANDFERAAKYVLDKNQELYRRLAS